jgi:hypothetical protein
MNTFSNNYATGVPMFPLYGYDNSEDLDQDMSYLKQLYPSVARQIQKEIDEECDKLEYDGSCMFDTYPDKVHLSMIVNRIYEKVKKLEQDTQTLSAENLRMRRPPYKPDTCPYGQCPPSRVKPGYDLYGHPNLLRTLCEILFYNELFNRRRRYRSRKRWF